MNDPNDVFTTKRTINHRTKQIETRIQRQIVIEDGKIISDSGPLVTTKTLEDNKEEIDEIEHKYAYCQSTRFGGSWPVHSKESSKAAAERESKKSVPVKTYIFGADNDKAKSEQERTKFQDKCSQAKTNKPSKYFYFGQNIHDVDGKEKENSQVNNSSVEKAVKSSKDNSSNSNQPVNGASSDEKDCQFVYEYSDFSQYGKERT